MPAACLHCETLVLQATQRYCPQCGDPTPPHRIDWRFLGHELEHSVLHMDRGLLFTLRELVLRPGRLLRDYLAGRRHGHARPLLLISISAAAVVLAAHGVEALHEGIGRALVAGQQQAAAGSRFARANAMVSAWFEQHYALATLLLLPLETACFRLVFGRRAGLNYPEWLVVMAYITVQAFLVQLVALGAIALWPQHADAIHVGVSLLMWPVVFLTLRGLFTTWSTWRVAVRSLAAFLLFLVMGFAVTTGGVLFLGVA